MNKSDILIPFIDERKNSIIFIRGIFRRYVLGMRDIWIGITLIIFA